MRELLSAVLPLMVAWLLGWAMHGDRQAKIELAISQVAAANRLQVEDIAGTSARQLENKLTELRANEVHTERLIRTEIIKPVFGTVCATDEYVRLFNASAERAERTLSGKLVDPLPGNAATPGR
ncbi:TPA: hypothetical protein PXO57_000668 [Yersinia enterocolitica]|nr:hypothetical protein [Yersinia enterocolitica]HDL7590293.1 hypothetical protein [Yersinia enterocolitica]HDL7916784.1 hypothetical protein [Yersinia enterocolitica]HDV5953256.1 hypothetical protein [Yersinia enterocolitica]HED5568491.1 hypothetical protein [Yersinia enterocolitica]